jgi:PAS domain S-box-containing protein
MVSPGQPPAPDSAELLRQLYQHAELGLAVFGADSRLLWCNAGFEVLAGLAPGAATGQALGDQLRGLIRRGVLRRSPAVARWQRQWLALKGVAPPLELRRSDGHTIEIRRRRSDGGGAVVVLTNVSERKALQAAKAADQRVLRLLVERIEQGVRFIDAQQRNTDADPAMCRLLGLPLPQQLERPIRDFVDEAGAAQFRDTLARRHRGVAEAYEITLVAVDGMRRHCVNDTAPLTDTAGPRVGSVGLWLDITQLKEAERRLADQSQSLALTVESLHEGVFTSGLDGHAVVWNRQLRELLDMPEALLQSRPTIDEIRRFQIVRGGFDHDPQLSNEQGRRAIGARYRRLTKDGRLPELEGREAADGCLVRPYRDVTADMGGDEALRLSEERFRAMADAAPALIWLGDGRGRPLWFNQRWLGCTGRTLAEELRRPWSDRLHAEDLAPTFATFMAAVAAQQAYEAEFRIVRSDGVITWVADHGTVRLDAEGRFEGFTFYGWDITERKAAQQALAAAKDEAERLSRAKSEFLSRMSHELRTPLNAVLGFSQLLAGDASEPLTPRQHERVRELQRGGAHLLDLINDVLDLARIEAGALRLQLQAVDLCEAVRECQTLIADTMARHGVTLQVECRAGSCVWADPTRLRQVLLNLLSNAAKYNRPGGTARLSWAVDGDRLRVQVQDEGPGLGTEQLARLFSPFERLGAEHGAVEGTGIGLALTRWLVERMDGRIGVDSRPGAGSSFWFELRAAPAAAAAPAVAADAAAPASMAAAAALAPAAGTPRPRVLYIEDNEVNRLLMQGMLALRPGLELQLAALPEEGLAQALAEPPALVLLDIQLPGMDGFEVLERLRAAPATAAVPVVAVSANAMPADRERATRAGFDDYVTKPVDLPGLLRVVDRFTA